METTVDIKPIDKSELVKQPFDVVEITIKEGDFGNYALFLIRFDGELRSFTCGGKTIMSQVDDIRDRLADNMNHPVTVPGLRAKPFSFTREATGEEVTGISYEILTIPPNLPKVEY